MKYLAIFLSILILISFTYSNTIKYNKEQLSNFLKNLNVSDSPSKIEADLDDLNSNSDNDKKFSNFRFKSTKTETMTESGLPLIHEGWIRVNSEFFNINNDIPTLMLPEGPSKLKLDDDYNLINDSFEETPEAKKLGLDKTYFYYRINKEYIFFSNSKTSNSIVFLFRIDAVKDIVNKNDAKFCVETKTFPIGSKKYPKFLFCNPDRESAILFECVVRALRKETSTKICFEKMKAAEVKQVKIVKRQINQPFIVIPSPQRVCNQGWGYEEKGSNWECMCKEGKEQSPIDLPFKGDGIRAPSKPLFRYNEFNEKPDEIKIEHDRGTLRIKTNPDYPKGFGELVTQDGTIYFASSIIFHTPAEHTVNGKRYPLEIQVLHEAKTKGDFGKKAVVSFLFEGKPGVYNKFLDGIEFFNLPNPHDKERNLKNKLLIPNILRQTSEVDSTLMKPSNFYTYQGSLSYPPCTENVINFVFADPIQASVTSIELIREALRMPDFENIATEEIVVSKESVLDNYRNTQPLNGRPVFYYDNDSYNPEEKSDDTEGINKYKHFGHYEKTVQEVNEYMFVEGKKPSGIPGALVVKDEEALK